MPLRTLPPAILTALAPFAPLFSARVWCHVQVLLAGALLAPARRTVAAALRVLGLDRTRQFHRYHRVLSRARWSGLAVSRTPLRLLVAAFAPDGPLVFGVGDVRHGSIKRVAEAVGEGSVAVGSVHRYLAEAAARAGRDP